MRREEVELSGWTDRVYLGPGPPSLEVVGAEGGGSLQLTSTNLPDTVIWNPWQEKVGALPYPRFPSFPLVVSRYGTGTGSR